MNKKTKGILVLLVVLSLFTGIGAAVTITGANINTGDRTPKVGFTVTGNNTTYLANLYVGNASGFGVASGYATITNTTPMNGTVTYYITCNRTLSPADYVYNVSVYNATEIPVTSYSSDYTMKITYFGTLVDMIQSAVGMFTPMLSIVVKVVSIIVTVGVGVFIVGFMTTIFTKIKGKV